MKSIKHVHKNYIAYMNEDHQFHRLRGPAVEYTPGGKGYYIDGVIHRLNGPAVEYADGDSTYYINGNCLRMKSKLIRLNELLI